MDQPEPRTDWMCPLPETGVLAVSGEDAGKLLQGQCTCDILGLSQGTSTLGAFCNAKGRVITVFRALRSDAVYYLLLPKALTEDMANRLRRVILRSAVRVEDVSHEWQCIGAAARAPGPLASCLGLASPLGDGAVVVFPGGYALGLPATDALRVLLMIRAERAEAFARELQARGLVTDTPARWLLADIRSGLVGVTPATSEQFVPQMLNLDALGAISFNKGCYIGQEVVARTHYLGKLKRRTFRLRAEAGFQPQPGDPIYEYGQPEQNAGTVILSAPVEGNGHELLAVLSLVALDDPVLRWHDADGPILDVLPLPYQTP